MEILQCKAFKLIVIFTNHKNTHLMLFVQSGEFVSFDLKKSASRPLTYERTKHARSSYKVQHRSYCCFQVAWPICFCCYSHKGSGILRVHFQRNNNRQLEKFEFGDEPISEIFWALWSEKRSKIQERFAKSFVWRKGGKTKFSISLLYTILRRLSIVQIDYWRIKW